MTATSPCVGVKIEVTAEMIEAGCDAYEALNDYPYSRSAIVAAYKAMRALEPGVADPGVMQMAGGRRG